MQYVVKFEIIENACDDGSVHRRIVRRETERILKSAIVVEGEAYPDGGGGLLIVDVRRPEDLFDLIGSQIIGLCRVDTNPVLRCINIARGDAEPSPS